MDRRAVIAGLVAGGAMAAGVRRVAAQAPGPVSGAMPASPSRLFADTPFATNTMARHFRRVDFALPDVPMLSARGPVTLARVRGKTRVVALWAEWCAPCLAEIRDLAKLRPELVNERFDIGLVLTASTAKLDRDGAVAKLRTLGSATMPLLVEPRGGQRAAELLSADPAMSFRPGGFSLPCVLLVDAQARVRGRAFGAPVVRPGPKVELTADEKKLLAEGKSITRRSVLSEADKGQIATSGVTGWATPDGRVFLEALAGGLLDRV